VDILNWLVNQLSALFSHGYQMIYALLLFVLLDYITGVCLAVQSHRLSSEIGAKGITKKIAVFIVIAFCHILDGYLMDTKNALEFLSTTFYLANEAISIMENIARLGVPLPYKLKEVLKIFEQVRDSH